MEKKCHQIGCKVLETGICMDGAKKEDCSMFYLDEEINSEDNSQSLKEDSKSFQITLSTGEELSYSEISCVTNRYDSTLVFIIGESESGKTTLLAEFFSSFQKEPIGQFIFAGSVTQVGFEERAFLSTLASEGAEPRTTRTTSKDFTFLHLAVKDSSQTNSSIQHLLISDVYGEIYREAKVSSSTMQKLKLIKSADHILYIIDGEKLASHETRHLAIDDAKKFISRALAEDIFDLNTTLIIAVSKWDLLINDLSFSFEDRIEKNFDAKFSDSLKRLKYLRIAARPMGSEMSDTLGLNDLLIEWTEAEEYNLPAKFTEEKNNRYFNNFQFQTR